MSGIDQAELGKLIGRIYDCAVDPGQWNDTLTRIRDHLDLAFLHLCFVDGMKFVDAIEFRSHNAAELAGMNTTWPTEWTSKANSWWEQIPGIDEWRRSDVDHSVSQMQAIDEAAFKATDFFNSSVKPLEVRDYSCTLVAKRQDHAGWLIAATRATGDLVTADDRRLFRLLSPHVRRSLMIGRVMDEGRLQLQLHKELLDRINAPLMIVGNDARLVYANGPGEELLSDGSLLGLRNGKIAPRRGPVAQGFQVALDRACSPDDMDLGTHGNGIALHDGDGNAAACYVLPMGRSDRRRSLGNGLALVFLATGAEACLPSVEMLSALCGLTVREARVALMIADGASPTDCAKKLGISITTLRTHLARVFDKTGIRNQSGLSRFIGGLALPVTPEPPMTGPWEKSRYFSSPDNR